jgi:hypothetical protein
MVDLTDINKQREPWMIKNELQMFIVAMSGLE